MEAINNITTAATNLTSAATTAASKAIWGDSAAEKTAENETAGTEPVAGQKGNVAAGEPYDKGNMDAAASTTENPRSTTTDTTTTTLPIHTKNDTSKVGVAGVENPSSLISSSDPQSSSINTSTDPTSTKQGTGETPTGVVATGPGPLTLEEKAIVGRVGESATTSNDKGLQKENHTSKAEEDWIKSNGVPAASSNSDAAKLGASKEVDGLVEEKSTAREEPGPFTPSKSDENPSTPEVKEKKSLKDKIKAKLHRDKD